MRDNIDSMVLATVNAPYSKTLDAEALVFFILNPREAKAAAGPMSSFFYDVDRELQEKFAAAHDIPENVLDRAAQWFDAWSGSTRAA